MNYRMCATLRRCVFLYSQVSVAAASCQDWLIVSSQLIAPACVCAKSQKPREPGLVFLNLAIQRGRSFCSVMPAFLEVHATPPAVFS